MADWKSLGRDALFLIPMARICERREPALGRKRSISTKPALDLAEKAFACWIDSQWRG
jgi:hypothetical protein